MSDAVVGLPRVILRIEGVTLFAASIAGFAQQGMSWWVYPALLLVPDIFMIGYLRDTRIGAIIYNVGHSYPAAAIVTMMGLLGSSKTTVAVGAIWFGHIGWDRMFGYGLKYTDSFKHTHLGML